MKTLTELRDELTHEVKSAGDILAKAKTEDRAVTPEDRIAWEEHTKRGESLEQSIDAAEATNALNAKQVENEERMKTVGVRKSPAIATSRTTDVEKSDGVINLQSERRLLWSSPVAFKNDTKGLDAAYRAGKWCQAVFAGNESARRWCINNDVESRALSEGVQTAGGTLVPEELLGAIISLREKYGVARQVANIEPMGTDVMTIPRETNDLTATFVDENTGLTESDPTLNNVTLTAKKLGILTRYSSEVAEDAIINLADKIAQKMAMAFAKKEDDCLFIGDGTATFGGSYGVAKRFDDEQATLTGAIQVVTANADTFAEIESLDLTTLMGSLGPGADNPKFFCSRLAEAMVFGRLQAAGGGNTIETLAGAIRKTYLGSEIVTSEVLPKVTTSLDNRAMILFGDLSKAATLGDRRGIMVKTSEDRYFELDQIAIKATERFALVVHDYGDTSAAGPIVALIGAS